MIARTLKSKNASTFAKCKSILSEILGWLLLFGVILSLLYRIWCEIQLSLYGIEGSAVVTNKYITKSGRRGSAVDYHISYKFTTTDNFEYTNTSSVYYSDYSNINIADTVKIIFVPTNPDYSKMTIQTFLNFAASTIVIIIFLLFLFLCFFIMYIC